MWNKHLPSIIIGLITTFSSICIYGQKDSLSFRPSFQIGLQYGMSWNTVQFSPVVTQGIHTGQRLALAMRYESDRHLSIQVETAYDKRGWVQTNDTITSNYSREIEYLELSFFTHISIGNRRIRPLILLGSYLSYPIGETENYPADWANITGRYYGQKLPERLQFGLAGGVGFEVKFNRFSLQFDGRYRSALGGIFAAGEHDFTFSNSQGFMAQISSFWRF